MTSCAILARVGGALIKIVLAVDTTEAVKAEARVVPHPVETCASIEAWSPGTVVGVQRAFPALIS